MTADESKSGCLFPFWMIAILFSGFIGSVLLAGQSTPIVTGGPQPPALEIVLVPEDAGAAWEQFEAAYAVINRRLLALSTGGQILAGYNAEISRSPMQMTIRLSEGSAALQDILAILTQSAYVELVDLSSVSVGTLQSYIGQTITTTAGLERAGDSANGTAFPTVLTQDDILSAQPITTDGFYGVGLEINLTDEGAQDLGVFSEAHIGSGMAVVVNGVVVSAPIIQARVETPIWLTGNFTEAEVLALAVQISTQPLPVPLRVERVNGGSQ